MFTDVWWMSVYISIFISTDISIYRSAYLIFLNNISQYR